MIIKILLVLFAIYVIYSLIILLGCFDNDTDNADYVITLGHKLVNDKPDEVLRNRLKATLKYADLNENCLFILSGGKIENNTISEAEFMKNYLIKNGIDSNRLLIEDKSLNTIQNIQNSKDLIDTSKKIVIITSNYHMFRTKMICKNLGLNVHGISTKTPILELLKHLLIEQIFIIKNYFDTKKMC